MCNKYQKGLTKLVRSANKSLNEDHLFRGRFQCYQMYRLWDEFSDGSGGALYFCLRVIDKKTKRYRDYWLAYAPYYASMNWIINKAINKFITLESDFWKEEPRHSVDNAEDFTNVYIDWRNDDGISFFMWRELK